MKKFKPIIAWLDAEQYRYKAEQNGTLLIYPTDTLSIRVESSMRYKSQTRVTILPNASAEYRTQKDVIVAITKAIKINKESALLQEAATNTLFHEKLLSVANRANATLNYIHTLIALRKGLAYVNIRNAHHDINVKYNFVTGGATILRNGDLEDEASVITQLESRLLQG